MSRRIDLGSSQVTSTTDGFVVEVSSVLRAEPSEVWAGIRTMAGVNDELSPWVRMTHPAGAFGLEDAPLGELAFQSWLLLLGVLPFDRHRLVLEEVEPGRRFLERSSTWLQRLWQHERTLEPHPEGCRVTDRVTVQPRIPGAAALTRPLVGFLFRSRHRVLRRRYNGLL